MAIVTGPSPGPPPPCRPAAVFHRHFVALAGVSPREGTQERAERGRGPQAVSEYDTGRPGP